jgi:hypothetical protein
MPGVDVSIHVQPLTRCGAYCELLRSLLVIPVVFATVVATAFNRFFALSALQLIGE